MFTEEELLEAVDILVEDYGFDEDYAIELVNNELTEDFKFSRDKQGSHTAFKGENPDGRGMLTTRNALLLNKKTGRPTVSKEMTFDAMEKNNNTAKYLGKGFRNSAHNALSSDLSDYEVGNKSFKPSKSEKTAANLAKHIKVPEDVKNEKIDAAKRYDKDVNSAFNTSLDTASFTEKSFNNAEKIYNGNKEKTETNGKSNLNSKKAKIATGVAIGGAAIAGTGVVAHKAYKAHKAKKEAEARRNRGLRGKLRRLRESENFILEEKYGIFEDEYGQLFIEAEMVEYVMDEYDLYEEDAIEMIMEAYEEELYNEGMYGDAKQAWGNIRKGADEYIANPYADGAADRYAQTVNNNIKPIRKAVNTTAIGGATIAGGAYLTRKMYKKHKAKKALKGGC